LEGWAALVDGARRRVHALVRDEHYVILRDGRIELSEKPTEDAVLVIRRRTLREPARLAMRSLEATDQILDSGGEVDELAVQSRYHAFIHGTKANDKHTCPIRAEMTLLTLEALSGATERMSGWIKEHDYHLRHIVLPTNSETAWITRNGGSHLIGEISFFTEKGWFQIVPTQTAKLEDVEELNRNCVKDLP
jgi:hypothetical protein